MLEAAVLVTASLANTAIVACAAVLLAIAAARFKGWSAASRYGLWWLMILFVIAGPIVSLFAPSKQVQHTAVQRVREVYLAAPDAIVPPAPRQPAPQTTSNAMPLPPSAIFLVCWCAAAAIRLLMLAKGFLFGIRLKQKTRGVSDDLNRQFRDVIARVRIKRPATLCTSDELAVPAVIGYFKPAILLPTGFAARLSAQETEQVLLHELAHIARYDDWAIAVQRFIEAMAAWHPLVRYLGYRLSRDREMACDDFVTAIHDPRQYAECLSKVAEMGPLRIGYAVMAPLWERKSELLARVEMMVDITRTHMPRLSRHRMLLSAAALVALGFVSVQTPRLMAIPAAGSPRRAPKVATPLAVLSPAADQKKPAGSRETPAGSTASVNGAVKHPGTFQFEEGKRVLDMLALAGGLAPEAGDHLTIKRGTGDFVATVRLRDLISAPDPALNISVQGGDIIEVAESNRSLLLDNQSTASSDPPAEIDWIAITPQTTIEFRSNGKTYFISDPGIVERAKTVLRGTSEVLRELQVSPSQLRQQAELSDRQTKEIEERLQEYETENQKLNGAQTAEVTKQLDDFAAQLHDQNSIEVTKQLDDFAAQLHDQSSISSDQNIAELRRQMVAMKKELQEVQALGSLRLAEQGMLSQQLASLNAQRHEILKLADEYRNQQSIGAKEIQESLKRLIREAQSKGLAQAEK